MNYMKKNDVNFDVTMHDLSMEQKLVNWLDCMF